MPYIGREPALGAFLKLDSLASSFNSACTTFTLTTSGTPVVPGSPQNLIVSYNGVLQEPVTAYTVRGSSIVFTSAPATGATFFAVMLGQALDVGTVAVDVASALSVNTAVFLTGNTIVTNSTMMSIGANVVINTSAVLVGNATTNTVVTSSYISAQVHRPGYVTLSDGATVSLDASLGEVYTLTAAGNRTIAPPTNPTNGQKIMIIHIASGADRTLTMNTSAGGFSFGTDITSLTATTSGKKDVIGCVYDSSKWLVVAVAKGY